METIWIIQVEVIAYVDSAPTTGQLGFINVVASADIASEAQAKVIQMFKEYEWEVLGIEDTAIADPEVDYQDGLNELIEDVIANPTHIRLSTLHSYKPT